MLFGLINTKRIGRKFSILFIIAFAGLNWFARQPYEKQNLLIYDRLPDFMDRNIYYLSNVSASITDSIGLTGKDCLVNYDKPLPLDGPLCGGIPCNMENRRPPSGMQYFKHTGFTVCYDPELRHPIWVASKVHNGIRKPQTDRPPFRVDPQAKNCPKPEDYTKSGYDRGHMAPNHAINTCYGTQAQKETFLLSNICPQKAGLNRGPWRKMEHMISDVWPGKYGDIFVITGAYSDSVREKMKSGIDIPDGFYKIAIAHYKGRLYALAVYMNQETGYGAFPRTKIVSIDELEKMTGLDFLPELPDDIEKELESGKATRLWPAGLKGNIRLLATYFRELKY